MVKFQSATLDDIIADAKENDRVDTLKSMSKKKIDGRRITFIELKRAYYSKYYEEMVPVAKAKKPSMWDRIDSL